MSVFVLEKEYAQLSLSRFILHLSCLLGCVRDMSIKHADHENGTGA